MTKTLELGNRWIRHAAPTLVGRLDALLTEAFGATDEIAGSLKSVCAAALGREVRLNQRKRKGDFSVIVKAIRRLLKDGLPIHRANVASSSLALKDLFGLQAVFEPDPDRYSQNRLIPESEVGRLREAEARLRALTTLSILDAKAFAESLGLLATSRIHATLSGATPIEIQLWIKGYLLPMRSHWYARHKGFSHASALERTAAEERVRRFRQLEISGAHEEAQEALFQELAFGHR